MPPEAPVTVHGHPLTEAQVAAMRTAITSKRLELAEPAYRARVGEELAAALDARLAEVEALLCACDP